jgi:hypothetical protein
MNKAILVVGFAALIVAIIVLGPFLVIWAWNTLFGPIYAIGYTVWTWLAVLIMGAFIKGSVTVKK